MAKMTVVVGIGLWGHVRDIASRMKFLGYQVDLWESRGWIEREFVFKGDNEAIKIADQAMNYLRKKTEQVEGCARST